MIRIKPSFFLFFLIVGTNSFAGQASLPHNFKAGEKAVAAQVNENFTGLATEVNDNDGRITDNAADIAAMQTTINTMQLAINSLIAQLTAVQANPALQLDGILTVDTDSNGHRRVLLSSVNLQVVNGIDQTTLDGTGNIIVGYNEPRTSGGEVCSDGQFTTQSNCQGNGGIWSLNHKTGSHNLIVGRGNSYSRDSGVVFGYQNAINRGGATVTGGSQNIASGFDSHVSGGSVNKATNTASSVSGGNSNKAIGEYSSVSGGVSNSAIGGSSAVSGGASNVASGSSSTVSGGILNSASGTSSSISGGGGSFATGFMSSVSGGSSNNATGTASNVSGGGTNTASGENSSVSGGDNRTAANLSDWRAGGLFQDF